MPELPEVEYYRKYFNAAVGTQRITQVVVRDDYVIKQVRDEHRGPKVSDAGLSEAFCEAVRAQRVTGTYRQGKYLFVDFDGGDSCLLHFGMTGDLALYSDQDQRPRHERLVFCLEDGNYLSYIDPRKFGKIRYLSSRQAYCEAIGLGPDALVIEERAWLEQAKNRKVAIKAFLLNQHVAAGVGNLYADEVLYQTRIDPRSTLAAVPETKLRRVYRSMQVILQEACERGAQYKQYPDDWFWQWRSKMEIPRRGRVERGVVAGRTTYWVSPWQRLYTLGEDAV